MIFKTLTKRVVELETIAVLTAMAVLPHILLLPYAKTCTKEKEAMHEWTDLKFCWTVHQVTYEETENETEENDSVKRIVWIERTEVFLHGKKSHGYVDIIVRCVYNDNRKRIGGDFVSITATELKMNLGKYLLMAEKEDIYITRNGKIVAKLSNPYQDRVDVAKSLFGIIPDEMTLEEAREERLGKL